MQCNAMQRNATQRNAMQYNTIQYNTTSFISNIDCTQLHYNNNFYPTLEWLERRWTEE